MPDLLGVHDFLDGKQLCWTFNLNGVEHSESWEGWLKYEVKLSRGRDIIASNINLTIHADDVEGLCTHLDSLNSEEFEPMEPDFQVLARHSGAENDVTLFIFLDEGKSRVSGYTGQGVGLRLVVDEAEVRSFTKSIRDQYSRLTKNLKRVD